MPEDFDAECPHGYPVHAGCPLCEALGFGYETQAAPVNDGTLESLTGALMHRFKIAPQTAHEVAEFSLKHLRNMSR